VKGLGVGQDCQRCMTGLGTRVVRLQLDLELERVCQVVQSFLSV